MTQGNHLSELLNILHSIEKLGRDESFQALIQNAKAYRYKYTSNNEVMNSLSQLESGLSVFGRLLRETREDLMKGIKL